jgi:hypothetical protein
MFLENAHRTKVVLVVDSTEAAHLVESATNVESLDILLEVVLRMEVVVVVVDTAEARAMVEEDTTQVEVEAEVEPATLVVDTVIWLEIARKVRSATTVSLP